MNEHNLLDPNWTEECLSMMDGAEMMEGKPLVSGLRRVSEIVIGEIISSRVRRVYPWNGQSSTVEYEVVFDCGDKTKTFSSVADVSEENVDPMFLPFATATAETRAEARCLRKALKLRTCSAEEMPGKNMPEKRVVNDNPPTDPQLTLIGKICESLDLNVGKIVALEGFGDLKRLTKSEASEIITKLNSWRNQETNTPKGIQGYNSNWRD